ncbi:hypothetical protein BWQ96_04921 [Gracilariopsis chorda]|uniref:C2H2-type domain-containing protein n=1 Tax=Gracilariopsis chorda TaxID=448386 RepID=A0A2V3IT86_9FLOR|nr:hypothetical protein BWQ96_04921 [Gracilariopsis chorda]|eukprot:PXF45331.1 hypothetical protein BWQ96_04921 [Gracilariopsis chorda]
MTRRDRSDSNRSPNRTPSSGSGKARKRKHFNNQETEIAEVRVEMPFHSASSQKSIPRGPSSQDQNPSRSQHAPTHTGQGGRSGSSMKHILSGPVPSQSSPRAQISPRKRRKATDGRAHRAYSEKEVEMAEFMAAMGSKQFTKQNALATANLPETPFTAPRAVQATAHPAPSIQQLRAASPFQPAGPSQPGPSSASQHGPSGVFQPGLFAAPEPGPSNTSEQGPPGASQLGLSADQKRRRQCSKCGKAFQSGYAARNHRQKCNVVLRCSKCKFQARSQGLLARHEKSHYDRVCRVCGFTTNDRVLYHSHMKTHQKDSNCEICGKVCRKNALRAHMRDEHPQQ